MSTSVGCRFDLTSYQDHLNSTLDSDGKKKVPSEIIADELLLKKEDRKGSVQSDNAVHTFFIS